MSKGTVNKVILIGNLGADPEIRTSPGGTVVANLRVATTEAWKDQSGQFQEHTEWHRVAVFGRTAEVVRDYLKKGSKLYIEGSLRTRKWQDKNTGQDRYSTEIFVNELQMLDRAGGGTGGGGARGEYDRYPPSSPAPTPVSRPEPGFGGGPDDFDDDIPF